MKKSTNKPNAAQLATIRDALFNEAYATEDPDLRRRLVNAGGLAELRRIAGLNAEREPHRPLTDEQVDAWVAEARESLPGAFDSA